MMIETIVIVERYLDQRREIANERVALLRKVDTDQPKRD